MNDNDKVHDVKGQEPEALPIDGEFAEEVAVEGQAEAQARRDPWDNSTNRLAMALLGRRAGQPAEKDIDRALEAALLLEENGLADLIPPCESQPFPSVGSRWQPFHSAGKNLSLAESQAILVERLGAFTATGYRIRLTLDFLVNGRDPIAAHVEAERQGIRQRTRDTITASPRFAALTATLNKLQELGALHAKLSEELAGLEGQRKGLADIDADAGTLAREAGGIAGKTAAVKDQLAGIEGLLADFRQRRDRQAQEVRRTATAAWVFNVQEILGAWDKARFSLLGLCDAGPVDVQGTLTRLCHLGMAEWQFRNLGQLQFADTEVNPILRELLPELSAVPAPIPSQAGVQIPGPGGRPALTVTPVLPVGEVDRQPVRILKDGQWTAPPTEAEPQPAA